MSLTTLIVESPKPGVTLIRLNRPQALNALNSQLHRWGDEGGFASGAELAGFGMRIPA